MEISPNTLHGFALAMAKRTGWGVMMARIAHACDSSMRFREVSRMKLIEALNLPKGCVEALRTDDIAFETDQNPRQLNLVYGLVAENFPRGREFALEVEVILALHDGKWKRIEKLRGEPIRMEAGEPSIGLNK